MKSSRRNELVVGGAFLIGVTLLGAYTIAVSDIRFGGVKEYVVDFPLVNGLQEGDRVRVDGFEVGSVTNLRLLDDGDIRAVLEVEDDVVIYRAGSEVKVIPFSPLGGKVVEIRRGQKSERGAYTPLGEDGQDPDVIQGQAEGELLQVLTELVDRNQQSFTNIVQNLEKVSNRLNTSDNVLGYLLSDEEGGRRMRSIASHLDSATGRLDGIIARVEAGDGVLGGLLQEGSDLEKDVSGAASAARSTLEGVDAIVKRAEAGRSGIGVLLMDDEVVAAQLRGIVGDVKHVTGNLSSGQGTLGKLIEDDRLYDGAAATAENLSAITARVKEEKGIIGVLMKERVGEQVEGTIEHVSHVAAALDDPDAGTLGMLIKDQKFRDRLSRVSKEVERLVVEFRDSVEDLREQAPLNAFVGAVFSAF